MNILFLDLASNASLLAFVTEKQTLAVSELAPHHAEQVVPTIENLLSQVGWTFADLTHIACAVGPGGFMSLRVGVATANALSYSLKIPIAGIHLSDVWAARVRLETSDLRHEKKGKLKSHVSSLMPFLWLHSTKRDSLFIRGFGEWAEKWQEPTLMNMNEFVHEYEKLRSGDAASPLRKVLVFPYVGELIPEHQKALPNLQLLSEVTSLSTVLPALLPALSYEQQTLMPWYGRGA